MAEIFSFYGIGLVGLGLSSLLLWAGIACLQFPELPTKLGTIVLVALVQYLLNRAVTFRRDSAQ